MLLIILIAAFKPTSISLQHLSQPILLAVLPFTLIYRPINHFKLALPFILIINPIPLITVSILIDMLAISLPLTFQESTGIITSIGEYEQTLSISKIVDEITMIYFSGTWRRHLKVAIFDDGHGVDIFVI